MPHPRNFSIIVWIFACQIFGATTMFWLSIYFALTEWRGMVLVPMGVWLVLCGLAFDNSRRMRGDIYGGD